ncbi:MAG: DUF4861 family protein, partial [Saprospiraceae bacterium]
SKDELSTNSIIRVESARTNIRFATKKDGYKEKINAARLKGTDTKITSQYFQMEGPAWENENVAFRNYFDERNGMDIFGKRTKGMILDKVGIDQNYHELQDWGMDILKVGNSLGAGGVALIIGDSLHRIGPNANASFEVIQETTEFSAIKFKYIDWKVHGRTYNVYHTISIVPGTHYYKSSLDIEGLKGDEAFACGIVDHMPKNQSRIKNYKILSTFGKQDMLENGLGMAVATYTKQGVSVAKSSQFKTEIDHTHLMIVVPKNAAVDFYFFTGWELSDKSFAIKEGFEEMLKNEIEVFDQ